MRLFRVCLAFTASLMTGAATARAAADDLPPPPALEHPALAAEGLQSIRRIPGLSLERSRFAGSASVLTAEMLRRSGARTLPEALARIEGFQYADQQGFGLGADSTLNLRGIVNSSRTNALVLVDGVRQNRITGDDVHWQSLPVDQIERVEIIRGGGGLIYGEGALAGVINIVTKQDATRLLQSEHTVELGSYGWQRYATGVRGTLAPLSYALNYTRRLLDGYRESSFSRNTTITTHGALEFAPLLRGGLHVLHSEDTTGFPGSLSLAETEQRRRQTNPFHGLNANEIDQVSCDLVGGPWAGTSGALTMYWRRWVQTSEDSINFNAFTVTPSRGLSLRSSSEWMGEAFHDVLVSGIELSEDKATTGDPGAGADSESNRAGYGLYLEDTLTILDRVSLVGGLRYDRSRYEESLVFPSFAGTLRFEGWSPRVGLAVVAIPDTLEAFTAYARPFKAPNVDDFSSRLGSSFVGNADLQPQQADSYEVGVRLMREPASATATAFYTRISDEILLNQLSFTNENFDTRRFGVELAARVQPAEGRVRGSATYMFVDAEFRKGAFNARTIPGTPEHTLNTSLGVSPFASCWLDLHWRLVHDFYRINDFNNVLGGADNYGVLGLSLRYEVPQRLLDRRWPALSAYMTIDNITNEEYVTFQSSNALSLAGRGEAPMPPTNVVAGVTVQF